MIPPSGASVISTSAPRRRRASPISRSVHRLIILAAARRLLGDVAGDGGVDLPARRQQQLVGAPTRGGAAPAGRRRRPRGRPRRASPRAAPRRARRAPPPRRRCAPAPGRAGGRPPRGRPRAPRGEPAPRDRRRRRAPARRRCGRASHRGQLHPQSPRGDASSWRRPWAAAGVRITRPTSASSASHAARAARLVRGRDDADPGQREAADPLLLADRRDPAHTLPIRITAMISP